MAPPANCLRLHGGDKKSQQAGVEHAKVLWAGIR